MAKKSSTIHIEEGFWDEISSYMKENKIDSRNTAIEQMLMERRVLLMALNSNQNIHQKPVIVKQTIEAPTPKHTDSLDLMIDDAFDTMK